MSQTYPQEPSLPQNPNQKEEEEEAPQAPLEGEALREALKNKIEYIFSKEYLALSPNLFTLVNSELLVSVDSLCQLQPLESLTKDRELILEILRSCSDKITFDESTGMVKPTFKRNTIILRDIPNTIEKEKIQNLFEDSENHYSEKIVNIRPDVGDTWFITFEDEDTTGDAFFFVRTKKLDGKPVQARIKSETFQKSFDYPSPNNNNTNNNNTTSVQNPVDQSSVMYQGPIAFPMNNMAPMNQRFDGWDLSLQGRSWHGIDPSIGDMNYQRDYRYDKNKPRYGGRGRRKDGYAPIQRKNYREGSDDNRRGRGNRKGRKVDRSRPQSHPVQLGPSHFPPLPNRNSKKANSGYKREFKKYNKEQFVAIIGATEDIPDPQFDDPTCGAISSHPHKELEISKPLPPNTKMYSDLIESKHHKKARSRSQSQLSKDSNASADETNAVVSDPPIRQQTKFSSAPSYKDTVKKKLPHSNQSNGLSRNPPPPNPTSKSTTKTRSNNNSVNSDSNPNEKSKTETIQEKNSVVSPKEISRAPTPPIVTSYADIARVSSYAQPSSNQIPSTATKKSNGGSTEISSAPSTGE